jgi:phosphate/sulfate permease
MEMVPLLAGMFCGWWARPGWSTITGAIIGVGSTMKMRGIRWGLASNIVWAWVLTIPASAGMGALCLKVFQALHVW